MAAPPSTATIAEVIHRIQFSLIDGAACTERQLFAAGALLSQPDYEDVVVERSIADLCGYPRCPNPLLPGRPQQGRFRIALREHRVYDLQETYNYCSPDCVVGSRAFAASLPAERCFDVVSSKVEQVLGLFSQGGGSPGEDLEKDGDLGLSNLTIQEKGDVGADEVSFNQWIGPSNAIEGYVPQHDLKQGSKFSADTEPTKRVDDHGGNADFTSTIIVGDGINAGNVSEQIAKQLEDVVISEKKTRTNRTSSKPSKSKPAEMLNNNASSEADFRSTVIIGDRVSAAPSNTSSVAMQDHSKQFGKELENGVQLEKKKPRKKTARKELEDRGHLGKKTETKEAALKSSLKTSGSSKGESRSVTWADERINESLEEKMECLEITKSSEVSHEEDDDNSLRLASAEACAAALIQAAEAVASGEPGAGEAVSDAGILILPQPQYGDNGGSEANEDMFEFDRGLVKWPNKPVLLDTDMFDVEDSWHDTPPEGFNLTLSSFATMWMALFGWITCSSLAHIYGHDESSQEDFLLVNGREYPRKIVLGDGKSFEIRQTLDGCISRALPGLVTDLRLPTPVSTMEKAVGRLLDTMTFVDALPSFRTRQWHVIVLLFMDALSVHRLPALAPHMINRDMLLHKVLNAAQVSGEEYESMRDLIIPLGRLPQFSMQCGG